MKRWDTSFERALITLHNYKEKKKISWLNGNPCTWYPKPSLHNHSSSNLIAYCSFMKWVFLFIKMIRMNWPLIVSYCLVFVYISLINTTWKCGLNFPDHIQWFFSYRQLNLFECCFCRLHRNNLMLLLLMFSL